MRQKNITCIAIVLLFTLSISESFDILDRVKNPFISKYRTAIEAVFGIGVRSTAILSHEHAEDNVVISPVSLTVLLGQMMLGADGELLDQLYHLMTLSRDFNIPRNTSVYNHKTNTTTFFPYAHLHYDLRGLLLHLANDNYKRNFTLRQSSALFVDKTVRLKENFESHLVTFYGTDIQLLDFLGDQVGSLNIINKWAEKQTRGLIKEVLPQLPSSPKAAIFANAIYFLADWENPFSYELNRDGEFYVDKNKTVNVTYMAGFFEDVGYFEAADYKMAILPYKNEEVWMFIILPNEDHEYAYDIKKFGQTMNETEIFENIFKGKKRDVVIQLPKMTLKTTVSILKPVQKYVAFMKHNKENNITYQGNASLNTIQTRIQDYIKFDPKTFEDVKLTGAAENLDFEVSDIVQQLILNVNEKGTEAAAVSASIIDYMGGYKSFQVKRPFLFFIMERQTLLTLFWGSISDPTKSK